MTQQQPPATGQVQITAEDFNALMQIDESVRIKVHNIALQRRVAELEAQIAESDTTNTTSSNSKQDSKLTAVGAD